MPPCPFIIALILALAAGAGGAPLPPEYGLPALRGQFDQAVSNAMAAHDRRDGEMPARYVAALESAEADRRRGGDLDAVVALRSERTRFLTESNVVIEAARAEHPEVRDLKRLFLRQRTRSAGQRDTHILSAARDYTNQLARLRQQLTREGRLDAALLIQSEADSVSQDPRVRNAALAPYTDPDDDTTPADAVSPAPAPAAGPGDPARLIEDSLVSFSFTDAEIANSDVLARLQRLCLNRGVALRFASRWIELRVVKQDPGLPRFVAGFRPATPGGSRRRTYTLTDVPLRLAIQAVCLTAGLGYAVDRDLMAVVLLDADDVKATWSPAPLPAGQIAATLGSPESRRRHIGRTLLVEGRVTTALRGISDYSLTLDNGIRVSLPQTPANRARFERVRQALTADVPAALPVVAMGAIAPESSAQGLTIAGAVLLEIGSGARYNSILPANQTTPSDRPIRRVGE